MKNKQAMLFLTRCVFFVISICVLSSASYGADEEDLSLVFKPEDFGLRVGMPEQEMLGALVSQGFAFKAGGKYERVQGSKQFAPLLDYILAVSEESGARDVWDSVGVFLGVKDGILVAVGRNTVFGRFDGLKAYHASDEALQVSRGPPDGLFPYYKPRRSKERESVNRFNSLIWHMERRPSSDAEPESHVWVQDDVMTILTVRYSVDLDQRPVTNHREVSLWYLHYCSFPDTDKIFETYQLDCSK